MLGWLSRLVLDKRAREALKRPASNAVARPKASTPRAKERDPATALAEAEERMKRLPPEKAQLIRSAMLVHRARQSVLANLSDEERAKLNQVALKALLGESS
ncbi:hypothetical protein CCC_00608 [Paramagnetospirillum magnetotacticum MS-1]|uniref:Uncharacterized protein n=1 Tax=Paramagnetospirillum magnetotacticum MS-1 TaxID=272627 RepID=A0A0C2U7U3_PARME|nr:hypothetical protein [Paramagnetospirillum magnetotacticum]KIL97547.1 hypothetical protein CCC_00608 [Paramagnetospirillum magnetotacticum MS-1]